MKKHHLKYFLAAGLLLAGFTSCQDKLEDEYFDKDGITNPTIEGLFANTQQQLGIFRYSYGEMYHTINTFAPQLGFSGYPNDGTPNTFGWNHDPYNDGFGKLRSIMTMNTLYNKLSGADKSNYEIYMTMASVVRDFIVHQMTDMCNDIPYSEALGGDETNFFPKFDKQADIYNSMLANLKAANDKLKAFTPNGSFVHGQIGTNDVWFGGDMAKWRAFVNSFRIRLAMRLTNVNAALAKSTIQEVLADGTYAKDRATSITHVDRRQDQVLEVLIFRSFAEMRGSNRMWAPQKMDQVMRKAGQPVDPRLYVIFQPDKDGAYTPMPTEAVDVNAISSQISQNDLTATFPSLLNRTTFERNYTMPAPVISSTEVHLNLAEAALRWPDLGLVAATEFEAAIRQSIDYYYEINASSPTPDSRYVGYMPASRPTKPSDVAITAFVAVKLTELAAANATEKLGLIYDQRYVHYNVLRIHELWADTRRLTKELGARVSKRPTNVRLMERTVYPTSEELNNAANFQAVKAQQNYTSPFGGPVDNPAFHFL